jgi:hypothetical protein
VQTEADGGGDPDRGGDPDKGTDDDGGGDLDGDASVEGGHRDAGPIYRTGLGRGAIGVQARRHLL